MLNREGFTFIFKRNVTNNITNNEKMVIDLMKLNSNITISKISMDINLDSKTIQRIINELKKKSLVGRIGGTRGYWKVNE